MQAAPGDELDARLDDEHVPQPRADRLGERGVGLAIAGQLDAHRQRRVLLDPRRLRLDEDVAAHLLREPAYNLAYRRGEDVDTADDQHFVGPPDAAYARAGAAARARTRPDLDVVTRAEAQ